MIEVFLQANGALMLSAGAHCVEVPRDGDTDAAISMLADKSNTPAHLIAVAVTRATL